MGWRRGLCAITVIGLAAGLGLGGCDEADTVDTRACDAAAATLEACFGPGSADAFLDSCGPADAARVQGRACLELSTVLLDDKADATWDSAVLEAIRDAVRQAIEQGLTVALQQVLDRLGGLPAQDFGAYLLLETTDTQTEARTAAQQWAIDLAGRPGFEPTVVEYSSGFGVAHAPCWMDLDESLPRTIASLVMSSADTIEVLGGEIHHAEQTATHGELDVTLPIVLLPQDKNDAPHPACE